MKFATTVFVVAGLCFAFIFAQDQIAAEDARDDTKLSAAPFGKVDSLKFAQNAEQALDLGMQAWQAGEIDKAETSWEKALQFAVELAQRTGENGLRIAALDLLGVAADSKGELGKALDFLLQALENRKTNQISTNEDLAYGYNNIGAIYFSLTDWEMAESYYAESQRLYAASESPLEAAWPMANQGLSHLRNEKFQEAVEIFQKAEKLVVQSKDPDLIGSLYNNWGLALIQLDQIPEGIALLEKVIQNPKSLPKQQKIAAANLGFAYLQAKNYSKAIEWLNSASQDQAEILSQKHIAKVHLHRSEAFMGMEDVQNAESAADEGIRLLLGLEEGEKVEGKSRAHSALDQRTLVQLLSAKANALASQNAFAKAMEVFEEAFDAIDQLRSGIHASGSKLFLSKFVHAIYEAALTNAWKAQESKNNLDFEKVFNTFQRNKSILLQEELEVNNTIKLAKVPSLFRERLQTLRYEREYLQQKVIAAEREGNQAKMKLVEQKLFVVLEDLERLEKNLETDFPSLKAARIENALPDLAALSRKLLQEKTAHITYFVGEQHVFGIGIENDKGCFNRLGAHPEMETKVKEFVRACTDWNWVIAYPDSATAVIRAHGPELYEDLVRQLRPNPDTEGPAKRLRISPDGFLGKLSFEALLTQHPLPTDGLAQFSWLLHEADVQYEWSASQRQNLISKQQNTSVLAMAPMTGGQAGKLRGLNAKGLPGTAKELEGIAAHFEGQFLLGDSATKAQFLKLAPLYSVIHLAMHGYDDMENSALSHLDFANNARLLAWEIGNLDLDAELIVLSACQTGTGQIAKGEGVLSLGRSFISAGAKSVVMSLWKLEDAASSEIMSSFYSELSHGLGKAAALRAAKQKYLQQADDFTAQPAFWAGLILLGDDKPLNMIPPAVFAWPWSLSVLGFVAILIGLILALRRKSS